MMSFDLTDAPQFLACPQDVPWRLTPATTAVRWPCVVRSQPLPPDNQLPHQPNHQVSDHQYHCQKVHRFLFNTPTHQTTH